MLASDAWGNSFKQILGKKTTSRYLGVDDLTDMANEFEGLGQSFKDLAVNFPSDTKRNECSTSNQYAIESPGSCFLDEILSVRSSDFNNLSDIFKGLPFFIGTIQTSSGFELVSIDSL